MLQQYWLVLVLVFLTAPAGATEPREGELQEFAFSSSWLPLLHYKKHYGSFRSQVESQEFFLSENGRYDPLGELKKSLHSFRNFPETGCRFPARQKRLEDHFGFTFPKAKCPDRDEWLGNLKADAAEIIFAGPYTSNPASLLGHTFLRLFRRGEKSSLLSYTVGYMARTDPRDSQAIYAIKGLLGFYPGFFQIEPFYLKIGIYNNGESRDLWVEELNLSKKEVHFLQLHIWELGTSARFSYFFIDENCSYQILTLLEAARPSLNLSAQAGLIVLPAETVRLMDQEKLLIGKTRFRASIRKRVIYGISQMKDSQIQDFNDGKHDLTFLKSIDDPIVLDSLVDFWTHRNYEEETNLEPNEKLFMEETFSRRAALKVKSPFEINDQKVLDHFELTPPYKGHGASKLGLSFISGASSLGGIHGRWGAHGLNDPKEGYKDFGAIEYLGFDLQSNGREINSWKVLAVDIKSLEPLNSPFPEISWRATVDGSNTCLTCTEKSDWLGVSAGAGISLTARNFQFFFLPGLKGYAGRIQPRVVLEIELGIQFQPTNVKDVNVRVLYLRESFEDRNEENVHIRVNKADFLTKNLGAFFERSLGRNDVEKEKNVVGFETHF